MKSWYSVGTWKWRGEQYAEKVRMSAVRKFNTDARIGKDGNKFNIYVWGELDKIRDIVFK